MKQLLFLAYAISLLATPVLARDVTFRTIFWNMESGGSNVAILEDQIKEKADVAVWGFSEVQNALSLTRFEEAA